MLVMYREDIILFLVNLINIGSGLSIYERDYQQSRTTGFRVHRPNLFASIESTVKHMEIYRRDFDYIIYLNNYGFSITNGKDTIPIWRSYSIDSATLGLSLHGNLTWDSISYFYQINSTHTMLAYNNVYCVLLWRVNSGTIPEIFTGNCTEPRRVDVHVTNEFYGNIRSLSGGAENLYILDYYGTLKKVSLATKRVEIVSATKSIEYTIKGDEILKRRYGIFKRESFNRSTNILTSSFEPPERSYVINTNHYVGKDNRTGNFSFFNSKSGESFSLCEDIVQCTLNQYSSLLLFRTRLFVSTPNGIYFINFQTIRRCIESLKWKTISGNTFAEDWSPVNPLVAGVYIFELTYYRGRCLWGLSLSSENITQSTGECSYNKYLSSQNTIQVKLIEAVNILLANGVYYFYRLGKENCRIRYIVGTEEWMPEVLLKGSEVSHSTNLTATTTSTPKVTVTSYNYLPLALTLSFTTILLWLLIIMVVLMVRINARRIRYNLQH